MMEIANPTDFLRKWQISLTKDLLISPEDYQAFVEKGNFDKSDILRFAEEIDIHPSVVLGRLQNEGILRFDQFRELKENYYFVS